MKLELFVLGITAFLIYNTYHDGKYLKMIMSWKKYYQMAFFGVIGISVYLLMKRNPAQGKNMLLYANNMVKYMPIDKSSIDMFSPMFDFTSTTSLDNDIGYGGGGGNANGERRIMNSGKMGTKRSVSETKKKFVASQQQWKCGECNKQLNAWFEVDHKTRLDNGGTNEVSNLVALCRECHGCKTAMENL